jgi:hypothetical protein
MAATPVTIDWHAGKRQRTKGQSVRVNRGAALAGDRVFTVTDDARLIARDLVIPGIGGGDCGARGFLAAFNQQTGKEVWRFWTCWLRRIAIGNPGHGRLADDLPVRQQATARNCISVEHTRFWIDELTEET